MVLVIDARLECNANIRKDQERDNSGSIVDILYVSKTRS